MNLKKKLNFKNLLALSSFLCGALLFSSCASTGGSDKSDSTSVKPAEVEREEVVLLENGLTEKTEDGVILHCFCWNFNSIKNNMKEIAAAGYSAIQTSPVSKCYVGENGGLEIAGKGKWYYHYQPTEYSVGNYQLGTEEEFKAMCAEAHKYGVKVIVDAVMNHCTMFYDAITPNVLKLSGSEDPKKVLFHDMTRGGNDERDRYLNTQRPMNGLWDWNTQNPVVQNYHLSFLKQCVADGADGFRYDAAKCIELPNDKSKAYTTPFSGNYWPVVLQNGSTFQYGEILQEGGTHFYVSGMARGGYDDSDTSRINDYHALTFGSENQYNFHSTASFYGMRVRDAVRFKNMNVKYISDWLLPKGVSPVNMVTWVESHDSYCNDGTYKILDEQQVIRAYAILAARSAGTPLFFDRPANSSKNHPWGDNKIGPAGSDMYKDAQVVALNFFHNQMGNAKEELSNPLGGSSVLMIKREDKGFVIINNGETPAVFKDVPIKNFADGTYNDQAYGSEFTVKNGLLSGTVEGGKVAVIFVPNKAFNKPTFKPAVRIMEPSQKFYKDTISTEVTARGCAGGLGYQIDNGSVQKAKNRASVVLGENLKNNESVKLTVYGYDANGKVLVKDSAVYTKEKYEANTIAKIDASAFSAWGAFYLYAYVNDGESVNAAWPGEKMKSEGNGIYSYVLPFGLENATVIFNNGKGGTGNQYDGPSEDDLLKVTRGSTMMLTSDREWKKVQ